MASHTPTTAKVMAIITML
jgi:hypothetical protein